MNSVFSARFARIIFTFLRERVPEKSSIECAGREKKEKGPEGSMHCF